MAEVTASALALPQLRAGIVAAIFMAQLSTVAIHKAAAIINFASRVLAVAWPSE